MFLNKRTRELPLHLMLIPGLIIVLVYSYFPMFGIIISFEKFYPARGIFHSKWVEWDNFTYLMNIPSIWQVVWNTIFIASLKIITGLVVPIIVALSLNEVRNSFMKRSVQTLIYLPYFLSWVILAGILIDILSPSSGLVNQILLKLGIQPIFFSG